MEMMTSSKKRKSLGCFSTAREMIKEVCTTSNSGEDQDCTNSAAKGVAATKATAKYTLPAMAEKKSFYSDLFNCQGPQISQREHPFSGKYHAS